MRASRRRIFQLALVLALGLAAVLSVRLAPEAEAGASEPTVYAAASLAGVFQRIDENARYNVGGSNQLALQIRQGARADVFASAAPRFTQELYREGLVEKPRTLVYNKLVLITPKANPADITSVFSLRREGIKLVVAGAAVPIGAYTREVLGRLGLSSVLKNVVSEEPDVLSIASKVALGEADAGFVYVTDAKVFENKVKKIFLPARAQPTVRYEIAVVASSGNKPAARAFIKRVLGPVGRGLLSQAGFLLP